MATAKRIDERCSGTKEFRTTGILLEDNAVSLKEIEELADRELSLMPDGLLDNLSEEQIRDLFAYLTSPYQV